MNSIRYSRSLRASLLTSAAGLCIALVPVAHAEINDPTDPTVAAPERPSYENVVRESQSTTTQSPLISPSEVERVSQITGPTRIDAAQIDRQIVIANPNTPVTDRDPNNITGVGQMIVDTQDGFIGLCTGTLINARTVIFAAHCVNEIAASGYGQNSGGRPIAFGFANNNNAAGNSAFGHYLSTYNTNTADGLYDVNYVAYNPRSNEPDAGGPAGGFLYADVAIATLDTPAKGVPTWAMLFSALPDPGTIGANGTGYHVTIEGYGNNGTATTGSTGGIDYRRRIAENMLGALASLDTFENFLFGGNATANPQNLYWIDFDDPKRGQVGASPYDFNAWRDNAVPGVNGGNSQEGITASGDSGGPLILDRTYARQLVIGVLSGGYTRFFGAQPPNGYGTASFYQPLYLYWDWVAANNPYHYVSAVAGNGNWTDPTHWVSNLDPNYFIIGPNGQIVNGVPTTLGATTNPQPGFGQACFQSGGVSDCYDVATGVETVEARPIGTGGTEVGVTGDDSATVVNNLGGASAQSINTDEVVRESQAGSGDSNSALALPAATIDNGLPGATNFVPNNSDGNRLTSTKPRYFDVTLSANGTTTLNTAVTIDRFGIAGAGAVLDITSTGSLTSLMDINQITGTMQVNGSLSSPGDYFMMAGGLNGTGTITAPFFTSVAGTISPGTTGAAGTIGTLTFRGNIVLSSGNTYMLDLGANGSSDTIVVNRNGTGTGLANLGGRLVLNISGTNLLNGNTYTILTSQGGISGAFQTPTAFSAILSPKLTYTANAVTLAIVAGDYKNVVPTTETVAYQYALLLDRNRAGAAGFPGLYGPLDQQNASTIISTLNALRPAAETTVQTLGLVGVDNAAGFVADRVAALDPGSTGGTFARYGSPNQVASVGFASRGVVGLSGMGFDGDARNSTRAPVVQEDVLPEGTSAFVAGGYLNGDGAPAIGVVGRDTFDGWYVGGGIETWGDRSGIGFAFTYTHLNGTGAFAGNNARASVYTGSIYTKTEFSGGLVLDGALTAGLLDGSTKRSVNFLGTPYTLTGQSNSLVVVAETGLGYDANLTNFKITPRIAARTTHIGYSKSVEEGGPMALMTTRNPVTSIQSRAGLNIQGTGAKFRPFLNGTYIHEFRDRTDNIGAKFLGGVGPYASFALNSTDRDYFEVSGGLTLSTGSVDLSLSAETTVAREDYSGQAYRGSISFKF